MIKYRKGTVFDRHQYSAPQSITEKPMEVYYLDEWIIITLHVAGFLHQQYFNTSITVSDKSGLRVADCTVQSAEYWRFYGSWSFHLFRPVMFQFIVFPLFQVNCFLFQTLGSMREVGQCYLYPLPLASSHIMQFAVDITLSCHVSRYIHYLYRPIKYQ